MTPKTKELKAVLVCIALTLGLFAYVKYAYAAPVWSSTCTGISDFNSGSPFLAAGETVSFGSNTCTIVVNTANEEIGVRRDSSGNNIRDLKFDFKIDSAATMSGNYTLSHSWTNSFAADFFDITAIPVTGSSTQYRIKLTNSFDSANVISTKKMSFGTFYTIEVRVQGGFYSLFINNIYQTTLKSVNSGNAVIGVSTFGKWYSTGLSGTVYFQNLSQDIQTVNATSSGDKAQIDSVWAGWKARYLRSNGMIARPYPEGNCDTSCSTISGGSNYSSWTDVVSEGISYGEELAVQENDQTSFNSIELFASTTMERLNHPTFLTTLGGRGGHLMGYHYSDDTLAMLDWNWAPDGDEDRARALLWADARWGSSVYGYKAKALQIIADLKTYSFIQDTKTGGQYILSGDISKNNPVEMNQSYEDPQAYRMFYTATKDSFWLDAVTGAYHYTGQNTDTVSGLATTAGLPTNWASYSTSTNDVATSSGRDTNYSYDAFRSPVRLYWDYLFYGSIPAKSWLTSAFSSFVSAQWVASSAFYMEYTHYGACNGGCYEKTMQYYPAYFARLITTGDTIASTIFTNKITNNYTAGSNSWASAGDFFSDVPNGGGFPSYFGDSWNLFGLMTKSGNFLNFSPTSQAQVSQTGGTMTVKGGTTIK